MQGQAETAACGQTGPTFSSQCCLPCHWMLANRKSRSQVGSPFKCQPKINYVQQPVSSRHLWKHSFLLFQVVGFAKPQPSLQLLEGMSTGDHKPKQGFSLHTSVEGHDLGA